MKTKHFQIALSFVVLVSLACTCSALPDLTAIANDLATPTASASGGSGGSTSTRVAPAPTTSGGGGAQPTKGKFDTIYPLPASVKNFTGGGETVNFQTDMNLKDTLAFYRKEFANMGLKERAINTAITDATFSLVFDGHASGKAVVIQAVALGSTSTNINIRLEKI